MKQNLALMLFGLSHGNIPLIVQSLSTQNQSLLQMRVLIQSLFMLNGFNVVCLNASDFKVEGGEGRTLLQRLTDLRFSEQ